jgi:hypothetical protein
MTDNAPNAAQRAGLGQTLQLSQLRVCRSRGAFGYRINSGVRSFRGLASSVESACFDGIIDGAAGGMLTRISGGVSAQRQVALDARTDEAGLTSWGVAVYLSGD